MVWKYLLREFKVVQIDECFISKLVKQLPQVTNFSFNLECIEAC
jgi:hypothetical protein